MSARYVSVIHALCDSEAWPRPEVERMLIPGRKFRCDFTWHAQRLVLEIQGGAFIGGRHSFGMGQVKDMEKLNLLTLAGWKVLQATPRQITDGTVRELLARVLPRTRAGFVHRSQWETGQA